MEKIDNIRGKIWGLKQINQFKKNLRVLEENYLI